MASPRIVPTGILGGIAGKDGSNVLPTDTAIKNAIQDSTSQTAVALSASFAALDGVVRTVKASGDTKGGVLDWINDSDSGYLFHLHAGPDSDYSTAAIGIGTDRGHGGGLLISHKNDNFGLMIAGNPGSGLAEYLTGYSANPVQQIDLYAGAGAVTIRAQKGQGYADGAVAGGSLTTLTSASAAFTAGDNGKQLVQLTSRGTTDPFVIAPGTTITYVNATTVTLSQPATGPATGIIFRVAGRAVLATQNLWRLLDTDDSDLLTITRGSLTLRGVAGEAGNIHQVFTPAVPGVAAVAVSASGKHVANFGSYLANAGDGGSSPLFLINYGAGVPTAQFRGAAGQTADQIQTQDSNGAVQSRFDKAGRFATRVTTAPADADIAPGEAFLYFDPTPGAAGMHYKGKDSAGSVVTGAL